MLSGLRLRNAHGVPYWPHPSLSCREMTDLLKLRAHARVHVMEHGTALGFEGFLGDHPRRLAGSDMGLDQSRVYPLIVDWMACDN